MSTKVTEVTTWASAAEVTVEIEVTRSDVTMFGTPLASEVPEDIREALRRWLAAE